MTMSVSREQIMRPQKREHRYTMLLSDREMKLAQAAAARELRTLPDFIRTLIIRAAEPIEEKK
jgi:uncharacterized protein (DUF1778 family)